MTYPFSLAQLAEMRRLRNIGLGTEDIAVALRIDGAAVTVDDVRAAIRAGLPVLPYRKPRGPSVHDREIAVPAEVLRDRAVRRAAPESRNVTALLMGDPPPGRSALDAKQRGG